MADSNRPENNEHKESQEIESLPSSDQLENSVAESLKSFELSDISDSQSSSLKSKLIQHLTGVSRVLQEMSNEVQELAKKNDALIDELLDVATTKPAASDSAAFSRAACPAASADQEIIRNAPVASNEVQKLINALVDLADEKLQDLASKRVEEKLDELRPMREKRINYLAAQGAAHCDCSHTCVTQTNGQITFWIENNPRRLNKDKCYTIYPSHQWVNVNGLTFNLIMHNRPIYLAVTCNKIQADLWCRARIKVTFKNKIGATVRVHNYSKVFSKAYPGLYTNNLIQREELENDESLLGVLDEGQISIEVAIQADEPVMFEQQMLSRQELSQVIEDKETV